MRRTKAEAEKTKDSVLDAAEMVFFEKGVSRATLDQIACRAGVTRGAVYFHFKDKAEVFKALQDRIRLPQEDMLEKAVAEGHDDPIGLVEETALGVLSILATDERRQRILTILHHRCEDVGDTADVLRRVREAREEVHLKLIQLMAMAKGNGSLSPEWEPPMAARAILCTMTGVMEEWLRAPDGFPLVELGTRMISSLTRSMRA